MKRGHLFTVDELRAAGALYVPPAWRKSLSRGRDRSVQRDLFSGLPGHDEALPENEQPTSEDEEATPEDEQPTQSDQDGDVSAQNLP